MSLPTRSSSSSVKTSPLRWLILLSLFLFGPWGNALPAQEEPSDDPFLEDPVSDAPWRKQLDQLTLRLDLTDEQVPAAESLLEEYYTSLTENPPATPEEKRTRKRALRARFARLLTPEQQATLRNSKNANPGENPQRQKRGWLDVLLDDVATPLLNNRNRNRRKGG